MKLTKTCAKFLRKHGGTILAVAASVGVVATAIETGRATTKAQHILEVDKELTKFNEDEFGVTEEPPTKKQIVLMCWKAYVPAAILGGGTIACILGSNALNKKQIASLTAAYMALGKTYQTYRQKVIENIGLEKKQKFRSRSAKKSCLKFVTRWQRKNCSATSLSQKIFPCHRGGIDRCVLPNEPRLCSGWRDIHEQPL